MKRIRHPIRPAKGQSLVEYAIILALVAIVAIVALYFLGLGVERLIGVIDGALGTHFDDKPSSQHYIDISTAECDASVSQNKTGLWVVGDAAGFTDLSQLTGSTNLAVGTGLNGAQFPLQGSLQNFQYNPLLSPNSTDLSVCPSAVVIQAVDGTESVSPVIRRVIP